MFCGRIAKSSRNVIFLMCFFNRNRILCSFLCYIAEEIGSCFIRGSHENLALYNYSSDSHLTSPTACSNLRSFPFALNKDLSREDSSRRAFNSRQTIVLLIKRSFSSFRMENDNLPNMKVFSISTWHRNETKPRPQSHNKWKTHRL